MPVNATLTARLEVALPGLFFPAWPLRHLSAPSASFQKQEQHNVKGSGQECPLYMSLATWSLLRGVGEDLFAFSGGEDS
jgi:hypothetical protein